MERLSIINFLNDHCEIKRVRAPPAIFRSRRRRSADRRRRGLYGLQGLEVRLDVKRIDGAEIYVNLMNGTRENATDWIGAVSPNHFV
jgi:hypothetical protein